MVVMSRHRAERFNDLHKRWCGAVQSQPSKLGLPSFSLHDDLAVSSALLTLEISNGLTMTTEAAKAPTRLPPECDTPSVRHQGPIWPQGNLHGGRCLADVHANRSLTPPLRRMGRQQSVRWGRGAAHKDQGQSGKVQGADAVRAAGSDRQRPRG